MRLKVDIIVVAGGTLRWVRAVMNATKTIPIVILGLLADPVEAGLVESLARPGGNVTGLTTLSRLSDTLHLKYGGRGSVHSPRKLLRALKDELARGCEGV